MLKKKVILKQKRGTATLFMADLEEAIIKESEYKPYLWLRYFDDILFL